jgi:hypothetical protein
VNGMAEHTNPQAPPPPPSDRPVYREKGKPGFVVRRKSPASEIGRGAYAALPLLPLWEKVARRFSAETDEGCWTECDVAGGGAGETPSDLTAPARPTEEQKLHPHMRCAITKAEQKLRSGLRNRRLDRVQFRRQAPIGVTIALCSATSRSTQHPSSVSAQGAEPPSPTGGEGGAWHFDASAFSPFEGLPA